MHISEIWVRPVTSCAGFSADGAFVLRDGLDGDHKFMLVDKAGVMVSQRQFPKLCHVMVGAEVATNVVESRLIWFIRIPGIGALRLDLDDQPIGPARQCKIWKDECVGFDIVGPFNEAFSNYLGARVYLVQHVPERHQRMHDSSALGRAIPCNFADGYPLLVTTRMSLDRFEELSGVSGTTLRMRAQIILDGEPGEYEAEAENSWSSFKTKTAEFVFAKRCERCQIPAINPQTGEKNLEVTRTGQRHYATPGAAGWYFASNYVPTALGFIQVGQAVTVRQA